MQLHAGLAEINRKGHRFRRCRRPEWLKSGDAKGHVICMLVVASCENTNSHSSKSCTPKEKNHLSVTINFDIAPMPLAENQRWPHSLQQKMPKKHPVNLDFALRSIGHLGSGHGHQCHSHAVRACLGATLLRVTTVGFWGFAPWRLPCQRPRRNAMRCLLNLSKNGQEFNIYIYSYDHWCSLLHLIHVYECKTNHECYVHFFMGSMSSCCSA